MPRRPTDLPAALLRPRNAVVVLAGAVASVLAGVLTSPWVLLAGTGLTVVALWLSVAATLRDEAYLEAMARPGLSAGVDGRVRLHVAALRGSRHLEGERREAHRRAASMAERVVGYIEASAPGVRGNLAPVAERVTALVDVVELLAGEAAEPGTPPERRDSLDAELERIGRALEELEGRTRRLAGGTVEPDVVRAEVEDVLADVEAIEAVARDMRLLT